MYYTDEAYATMLLCAALTPDREEYARPLNEKEYAALVRKVRDGGVRSMAGLLNYDIGGLIRALAISEEEAYRLYILLHRDVELSYLLEKFYSKGIGLDTIADSSYPNRLRMRLEETAPPLLYRGGKRDLLQTPMVALLGISGVRTDNDMRFTVTELADMLTQMGYTLLTGGEPGVSNVVREYVEKHRAAKLVEIPGGGILQRLNEPISHKLLEEERLLTLSCFHPEVLHTASHAATRSKLLYALADACFIMNTDMQRGESDIMRRRLCDRVYAWAGYPENLRMIGKGAIPFTRPDRAELDEMSRHWQSGGMQLSIFDESKE